MVDYVGERWGPTAHRGRPATHPWATGLIVVAVLAGLAFAIQSVLTWGVGHVLVLWCGVAGLVGWATWRRSARAHASDSPEPVVLGLDHMRRRDAARPSQEVRRHRRYVPARRGTVLHMQDGRTVRARIVDISIAGVAVEARLSDVEFLSVAQVGSRVAAPVRRTSRGGVFGFATMLEPQSFDASFVL